MGRCGSCRAPTSWEESRPKRRWKHVGPIQSVSAWPSAAASWSCARCCCIPHPRPLETACGEFCTFYSGLETFHMVFGGRMRYDKLMEARNETHRTGNDVRVHPSFSRL